VIAGIALAAVIVVLVCVVQELRRRSDAAEADRLAKEAEQLRVKYSELSATMAKGEANASDRERRLGSVLTQQRSEIAQLREDRAACRDPDVVHARLTKLLSLGQVPVTGQPGPAKARVPPEGAARSPADPTRK